VREGDAVAHEVTGVVALGRGEPVSLERIRVPDPGPGEALVRVEACGVCHTDLHYREGGITDDFPFLLGHEAAGRVEAVGPGEQDLEPGTFVILNWRAVCGTCRACRRGRPQYCFSTRNAEQSMTLADGTSLSPALGIGAFAELTLVAAGQCTAVPPISPQAAGLLGCGVMAGLGAAIHTGDVQQGDSVAVFGCGGVGAAAVAGALLAGARVVVAIDVDERKLGWARESGATRVVNAALEDPVEAVRDATGGFGADVCIEAVGRPDVLRQAFYARDLAGTVVQVGVPTPDMAFPEMPMIDFFGRGGALKPSWYGDCLPSRDFPALVELYRQGRLDLDHFVTETIGLGDVEDAFARMQAGEVLRSVVLVP
jgi:S-(hydroxymethyl)mycothiol dehydrogenase